LLSIVQCVLQKNEIFKDLHDLFGKLLMGQNEDPFVVGVWWAGVCASKYQLSYPTTAYSFVQIHNYKNRKRRFSKSSVDMLQSKHCCGQHQKKKQN
jgi:hypothetical protein